MKKDTLNYQGLIAPCGMNCGLCIGYMREKNPCGGCFKKGDENKPKSCRSCSIANCELLAETKTGFCYECKKYPCTRLKNLDKRYRIKYGMSMIENLEYIRNRGVVQFLFKEESRWKCPVCGQGLCVHRDICLQCKTPKPNIPATR